MPKSNNIKNRSTLNKCAKAFTLIELLVSVGIFTFMTAFMVAKYGNFNQSVLLTNLAYDVAVTIRTAQAYGLSVKGAGESVNADSFQYPYGVHFDTTAGGNTQFFIFVDNDKDNVYSNGDEKINTLNLKRGAKISGLCIDSNCNPDTSIATLDVSFMRPDPTAIIIADGFKSSYAKIQIQASDGNTRVVSVRENGQISVED